ncbi:hypothetical protein ACFRCG_06690 [Embleya sp. NPDC056575]|uniref:hypothetical protein n=1 Tax=unclassified Embleya TaxID=2699296 RepID=UPI0036BAD781
MPPPPPPVREVVRWIIGRPERQGEAARRQLKELCERCPHFAQGLRKDLDAVTDGLAVSWNSGRWQVT